MDVAVSESNKSSNSNHPGVLFASMHECYLLTRRRGRFGCLTTPTTLRQRNGGLLLCSIRRELADDCLTILYAMAGGSSEASSGAGGGS